MHGLTCRRLTLLAIAALPLLSCGGGGPAAASMPASAPAPAPSVAAAGAYSQIDALLSAQVAANQVPGLQLAIARNGQIRITAYGNRALAPAVPVDADTEFQIGSITKQFTAACVLMLVRNGALQLDRPLSNFIPEYQYAKTITLREMLNMTSGIPSQGGSGFTTLYGPIDHQSVVTNLNAIPLDFVPGTRFAYSNAGYYLLGLVIERVSHEPYPQFITDQILTPLKLSHTLYLASAPGSDTATGYWHDGNAANPFSARPSWSSDYLFSMGGLVSNVGDIVAWHKALIGGQVIDPGSLADMFAVPALPGGAPSDYGMGWFIDPGERWHNGETSGFHSATAIYDDGYDIVLLGNTWDQYSGAYSPENLVLQIHRILTP